MTNHELARILLSQPELPVRVNSAWCLHSPSTKEYQYYRQPHELVEPKGVICIKGQCYIFACDNDTKPQVFLTDTDKEMLAALLS